MNKKKNFTEGPIGGPIFTFVLPMIASYLLQMAYSIADSSAVGRLVGSDELAAVSATSSFSGLIVNMLTGVGVGAGVLVARYFGAKDMRRVERSVHTSMIMSLIVGVAFCVAALLLHAPIIDLYIKEPRYVPIAKGYMGIICLGIPATAVYNYASAVLRSLGDTKTPLIIGAVTGLVNVALNYTLILGIEGIGDARKRALFDAFITRDAIAGASVDELAKVKGMSRPAAEAVYRFFHPAQDIQETETKKEG